MGTYDTQSKPMKVFEQAPVGTHMGRIYVAAEIGLHKTEYQGEVKIKNLLWIGVELSNTKMEDGRPFGLSKEYPLSFYDGSGPGQASGLYKLLTSLFGELPQPFTPGLLLGVAVTAVVAKKVSGKTGLPYSAITSLAAAPEGVPVKALQNPKVLFDINAPDQESLEKLPPWLQKKIAEAVQEDPPF